MNEGSTRNRTAPKRVFRRFSISRKFLKQDMQFIEPIWRMRFRKSVNTALFGEVTFRLTHDPISYAGEVFLQVKMGKHLYYVLFSSDTWLNALLDAFHEGVKIDQHPEMAAIALEAQFASELDALDKLMGVDLSFVTLSRIPPEVDIEQLPGARFTASSTSLEGVDISILPATVDANEMLVQILKKSRSSKPTKQDTGNVPVEAALVANVATITLGQLRNLRRGQGFMLEKDWEDRITFDLSVQQRIFANMKKVDGGFKIEKLLSNAITNELVNSARRTTRRRSSNRRGQNNDTE